jgi:hypothetical protein
MLKAVTYSAQNWNLSTVCPKQIVTPNISFAYQIDPQSAVFKQHICSAKGRIASAENFQNVIQQFSCSF